MAEQPEARASEEEAAELIPLLLDQVKQFTRRIDAAKLEELGEVPAELRREAAELGLFGLSIPESFGGLGLGLGGTTQVVAKLAEADRSVATTVGLHNGLGVRGLVELGEEGLKKRWLPDLAEGKTIAAFAATEPEAGSDLTAVKTTATVVPEGLSIDGHKVYVTNGGFAGLFTVLARTPELGGARAQGLICIPAGTEGLSIGPEEHKLGIQASSTVSISMDGAVVPNDHVLGPTGAGAEHAHRVLEWGRTLMASGCMGTARAALDMSVIHVQDRRQFGRAIVRFEAVRSQLASMASSIFAMEALIHEAGVAEAAGKPLGPLSLAAKVYCSDETYAVCDRAIQLHGAMGFLEETGVSRLLRDCRVTRIFEGANDVLLVLNGVALVAAPDKATRRLHDDLPSELGSAGDAWAQANEALSRAMADVKSARGMAVVRRQGILQSLSNAHLYLLAGSASLARGAREDARAQILAQHVTHELAGRAMESLRQLPGSDDRLALDEQVLEFLVDAPAGPKGKAKKKQDPKPSEATP